MTETELSELNVFLKVHQQYIGDLHVIVPVCNFEMCIRSFIEIFLVFKIVN